MVFCRGCGKGIHETALSCPQCGAIQGACKISAEQAGTLWLPVPSFIFGLIVILALFDDSIWDSDAYSGAFVLIFFGIVLGVFGVATQKKGRPLSIAGIVLGVIGIIGLALRVAS